MRLFVFFLFLFEMGLLVFTATMVWARGIKCDFETLLNEVLWGVREWFYFSRITFWCCVLMTIAVFLIAAVICLKWNTFEWMLRLLKLCRVAGGKQLIFKRISLLSENSFTIYLVDDLKHFMTVKALLTSKFSLSTKLQHKLG